MAVGLSSGRNGGSREPLLSLEQTAEYFVLRKSWFSKQTQGRATPFTRWAATACSV